MVDASTPAWLEVGLKAAEIIGCLLGAGGGVIVLLARKTFASIEDVESRFERHRSIHDELDDRLAAGDSRFIELNATIRSVREAADQARKAAEQASLAAGKANSLEISIAELNGEIKALQAALKPVERFTMTMVEGHMHIGEKTS